jgi:hypothetical protein
VSNHNRERRRRPSELRRGCIICGGAPRFIGVFVPTNQALYGAPPGKTRAVAYPLCQACFELEDKETRVEQIIARDLVEMAGRN